MLEEVDVTIPTIEQYAKSIGKSLDAYMMEVYMHMPPTSFDIGNMEDKVRAGWVAYYNEHIAIPTIEQYAERTGKSLDDIIFEVYMNASHWMDFNNYDTVEMGVRACWNEYYKTCIRKDVK